MREGVGREGRRGKEGDPEEETKDGRKGGKEETERGREEGKEAGREKERKKGEGRGSRKQRKRRISRPVWEPLLILTILCISTKSGFTELMNFSSMGRYIGSPGATLYGKLNLAAPA